MLMVATEVSAMDAITTALTSALTTVSTDALSAIGAVLPKALPIMGAIVVITVGIRIFKKAAK